MAAAHGTAYDDVLYPSALYSQTHPDRLGTMATLSGMNPAAVERCRVLELGCGDGANLIAMAHVLPGSEFIGIDLAERPIAKGLAMVGRLGLGNVSLRQLNVVEASPGLGQFDYIIAHGLYSWVPAEARDKILEICGRNLTANGVAYVSYNAYPGNHLRDLVRGMMRYHAAHFREPEQQIRQARALVKFLSESKPEPDLYHQLLKRELERVTNYGDGGFFHDDLSSVNQPVYFHEFMAHARRHGLQYLGEADITDMREERHSPQVEAVLKELASDDVIGREQYLDFLRCRAFRQTLLCGGEHSLDRAFRPERTHNLFIAGEIRPASTSPDRRSGSPELFHGPKNAEIETDRPLVKAALAHLGGIWPRRVHFDELLAHSRSQSGREGSGDADDLGTAMLQAWVAGFLELHFHNPPFVSEAGERPIASALARLQLESGMHAATLRHTVIRIEDELSRELLRRMDGTRDRAALREELGPLIEDGKLIVQRDGKPIADPAVARRTFSEGFDENVRMLARLALLVA